MFILGIDIGTRNLGMCVIRTNLSGPIQVIRWENADLFPQARNVNKIELGRLMAGAVDRVWEMMTVIGTQAGGVQTPLVMAIERQPNCNPRMKALGASVFSACYVYTKLHSNSSVHYVSPGKKFDISVASCVNRAALDAQEAKATTRARYAANKKDGILTCRMLLDTERLVFLGDSELLGREVFDASRKKDDLADSLLIALSYANFTA